ncbi:PP2C family protein-serine/threonine phosphatase [Streptomyces albiaxialis]|uniref:PP2C family protein-serine/threonine phosphatase n=1 Tax=Streptomyces albiaxialis TaxID=329523 RepID=A0ABN2WEG3_9ACTN
MAEQARQRSLTLSILPFAVMAIVAVIDFTAGPGVGFLPLVSLGPAFATLAGSWRRTALVGALALALCTELAIQNDLWGERRGYTALASVAGVTVAGAIVAIARQRRMTELAHVRSVAEVAQRVLLRPVPRHAGNLRVAVSYTSAAAEARIGGDLYEVVASPRGVRVIVGDVQGKGLEAVETVADILGAFREAAHDEADLVAVSARLERAAERQLTGEKFCTAVLAEVTDKRSVTMLNHGHPPPLLVRPDGEVRLIEPPRPALPLGLGALDAEGPRPFRVDFVPGDQILLYTDGVSESRDRAGRFYPLEERGLLLKEPDPEDALATLRADLVEHSAAPLHDDAAMLLLRYHGA